MALFNFRPETPQEKEQRAVEKARKQYEMLLGQSPQTALASQEGPIRPGEFLPPIQQTTQGSGLLGGQVSPQEFLLRTAGMPGNMGTQSLDVAKSGLLGGAQSSFEGKGVDPQIYNKLIKYGQKPPQTPQEKLEYNIAYQRASRPQRFMDPSGQMIEYPGMNMQGFPIPEGLQDASRKTLGQKPMAAESASKLAMMDVAQYGIGVAKPILFKGDEINKKAIKEMYAINMFGPSAALMSSDGQKLYNAFEYGKQAITRTETGAAMPPSEVANTAKRFMPTPWDNKDTVKQKWEAYNLFIKNTSKYLDPNSLNADAIFTKAMADVKTPEASKDGKIIDWKDLP